MCACPLEVGGCGIPFDLAYHNGRVHCGRTGHVISGSEARQINKSTIDRTSRSMQALSPYQEGLLEIGTLSSVRIIGVVTYIIIVRVTPKDIVEVACELARALRTSLTNVPVQ